jgi:hypothetical protein
LDKPSKLNGQKLILLIDQDSYTIIKKTGCNMFTGLSQRIVKVLRDPKAKPQQAEVPGKANYNEAKAYCPLFP